MLGLQPRSPDRNQANFRLWLQADIPRAAHQGPLCPQHRTSGANFLMSDVDPEQTFQNAL